MSTASIPSARRRAQALAARIGVQIMAAVPSATGMYVVARTAVPFSIGATFSVRWGGESLPATVEDCDRDDDKFLVGLLVKRSRKNCAAPPANITLWAQFA